MGGLELIQGVLNITFLVFWGVYPPSVLPATLATCLSMIMKGSYVAIKTVGLWFRIDLAKVILMRDNV